VCTGCSACVSVCPTHIIVMEKGRPRLDFSQGECVFCGDCAGACPGPVFATGRPARFEHIVQVSDSCLAVRGVACIRCRDACPSNAIRFRPRVGAPFLPEIQGESCTGCGACIAPCPASAISVAAKESMEAAGA
jgi:ferredoxin-type protein NapF